jgi:hypothetical protein
MFNGSFSHYFILTYYMPTFTADFGRVYDGVTVRVDRRLITTSSRINDNGINATLYATDCEVMFYMIRNMVAGSFH